MNQSKRIAFVKNDNMARLKFSNYAKITNAFFA